MAPFLTPGEPNFKKPIARRVYFGNENTVKIVTAAIIEMDGRVLIARRAPHSKLAGKWEFPGGKVEEGESPEQCLERELLEELRIQTVIGEHFCSSEHQYEHGKFRVEAFFAQYSGGKMVLNDHDKVEWVDPDDLERYELLPADIPIARMLTQRHDSSKS